MKPRADRVLAAVANAPKKAAQRAKADAVPSHLMTRMQVAKSLGVSHSLVCKWEREGQLTAQVLTTGVHAFDKRDVELYRVERARNGKGMRNAHTAGEVAAQVFAMLEAGERPIAIVTTLTIHPDVVEACAKQWARMRGSVVVDPEQLQQLRQLLPRNDVVELPAGDAQQLVAQMRRAVDAAHLCVKCNDATARFCGLDCGDVARPSQVRPAAPRPAASRR
jgi:DNA-binding transcriptional MerR regulator